MKLLVSVRDEAEALAAASHGADIIDLKEPRAGALGALAPALQRQVVAALRGQHPRLTITATIGDWPMDAAPIVQRVREVAASGADIVKVGITPTPGAGEVLQALAVCGQTVVPVLIADHGLDEALLAQALAAPFPGIVADTADKTRGSLFDCVSEAALRGFIERARAAGKWAGLAGALRRAHLPRLHALQPDIAGFRGAVCDGARTGMLVPAKVRQLAVDLGTAALVEAAATPG
jgi:uncharacterized protein (UPF0264 family)